MNDRSRFAVAILISTSLTQFAIAQPKPVHVEELKPVTRTVSGHRIEFSPDGQWLAMSSSRPNRIALCDTKTWKSTYVKLKQPSAGLEFELKQQPAAIVFDAKSKWLVVTDDGVLFRYSVPQLEPLRVGELNRASKAIRGMVNQPIESFELIEDGKAIRMATSGQYSGIKVCRFPIDEPDKAQIVFQNDFSDPCACSLSSNGGLVAFGRTTLNKDSTERPDDYSFEVWTTNPAIRLKQLSALNGRICVSQFSLDGKYLATGGTDGSLMLFDVATGKLLKLLMTPKTVYTIDFNRKRPLLAYGSLDNRGKQNLFLLDLDKGDHVIKFAASSNGVIQVRFSPDGKLLAVLDRDYLQVWNVDDLVAGSKKR